MHQSIVNRDNRKLLIVNWIYPLIIFWFVVKFLNSFPAFAGSKVVGIDLDRQVSSQQIIIKGRSGGSIAAHEVVNRRETPTGSCSGFINRQPNYTLTLHSFFNFLKLEVNSKADTTIVVQGPGGVWCNDDFESHNPTIEGQWLSGTYNIWIGSYKRNTSEKFSIKITQ